MDWFVGKPKLISPFGQDRQAIADAVSVPVEHRDEPGNPDRSMSLAVDHAKALATQRPGSHAAAAVLNPLGKAFRYSFTGSGKYLAQQSGGIVVEVVDPAGLGRGLSEVTSAYVSRYARGFRL